VAELPEDLMRGLRSIFGAQGAWIFEDAILKKLHEKLGLEYDGTSGVPFKERIRELQALYVQKL